MTRYEVTSFFLLRAFRGRISSYLRLKSRKRTPLLSPFCSLGGVGGKLLVTGDGASYISPRLQLPSIIPEVPLQGAPDDPGRVRQASTSGNHMGFPLGHLPHHSPLAFTLKAQLSNPNLKVVVF